LNIFKDKPLSFLFITTSFLLVVYSNSFGQNINIRDNSFYYPHALSQNEVIHTIGFLAAKLPEDVIETDDVIRSPLISYKIKYGLPSGFLAESSIETNIFTFHFSLGAKWNYEFGNFSASLGSDLAYWFGTLDQYGFDTKMEGLHFYPNVSMGYLFENVSLTIKSDLLYILSQSTRTGDVVTQNSFEKFSGYSVGIYVEQPLWKNNFVVLGFKSNFTRFYYPMWAGFSTFERFFFIPEFVFSFNL
jgi:hypothetical protein